MKNTPAHFLFPCFLMACAGSNKGYLRAAEDIAADLIRNERTIHGNISQGRPGEPCAVQPGVPFRSVRWLPLKSND